MDGRFVMARLEPQLVQRLGEDASPAPPPLPSAMNLVTTGEGMT
jgi:hypothetical protein